MINIKPCPFCGNKYVELTNAREIEECANFEDEECPECFEQSSCSLYTVVCSVNKGGCGASSGYHTAAEKAIEAWNKRSVENIDSINRQAAIDALCSVCGVDCDKSEFVYDRKYEDQVILCPEHYVLTQLPSAQSEQKKGKWISIFDEEESKCSECGKTYYYPTERRYYFCPNCGADMRDE